MKALWIIGMLCLATAAFATPPDCPCLVQPEFVEILDTIAFCGTWIPKFNDVVAADQDLNAIAAFQYRPAGSTTEVFGCGFQPEGPQQFLHFLPITPTEFATCAHLIAQTAAHSGAHCQHFWQEIR